MCDVVADRASRGIVCGRVLIRAAVTQMRRLRRESESRHGKGLKRKSAAAMYSLYAIEPFGTASASLESARIKYCEASACQIDTFDVDEALFGAQIRKPEVEAVGGLERERLYVARGRYFTGAIGRARCGVQRTHDVIGRIDAARQIEPGMRGVGRYVDQTVVANCRAENN